MDAPKVTNDVSNAAGKVLSTKYIATIVLTIFILMLLFSMVFKAQADTDGVIKIRFRSFKQTNPTPEETA